LITKDLLLQSETNKI